MREVQTERHTESGRAETLPCARALLWNDNLARGRVLSPGPTIWFWDMIPKLRTTPGSFPSGAPAHSWLLPYSTTEDITCSTTFTTRLHFTTARDTRRREYREETSCQNWDLGSCEGQQTGQTKAGLTNTVIPQKCLPAPHEHPAASCHTHCPSHPTSHTASNAATAISEGGAPEWKGLP